MVFYQVLMSTPAADKPNPEEVIAKQKSAALLGFATASAAPVFGLEADEVAARTEKYAAVLDKRAARFGELRGVIEGHLAAKTGATA